MNPKRNPFPWIGARPKAPNSRDARSADAASQAQVPAHEGLRIFFAVFREILARSRKVIPGNVFEGKAAAQGVEDHDARDVRPLMRTRKLVESRFEGFCKWASINDERVRPLRAHDRRVAGMNPRDDRPELAREDDFAFAKERVLRRHPEPGVGGADVKA